MEKNFETLFEKYQLGDVPLKNRFVMASMTRCRCDPKTGIPTDLHVKYYSQRASAGLIMTECSPIANNGQSFMGNGGIYTQDQVKGWKKVTEAVHAKGSKIFLQIWHAGRSAHPDLVGEPNIGPSAIAISGNLMTGYAHKVPKEMTKEDIRKVLDQFKQGALNAKEAGFDGIELHGANGYLVDQFLRDASNKRTDEYGGSVENRARFCLEAIDILISVFGAGRVGIKLSPVGRYQDMYDSNPLATYTYLLKELEKKGIAYVQLVEPGDKNTSPEQVEPEKQMPEVCKALRPFFKKTIIINNNQTPETATKAIKEGHANLVSFARPFMANPDYVERVKNGWPTNQPDFATAYSGGEKGYTDIPFYQPEKSSASEKPASTANKGVSLLFEQYQIGDVSLKNRFVMASMTRCRCDPKTGIPTDLHVLYYSQRASAGLIMTECSPIAKNGQSFMGNGGIYTQEQIKGWKRVTDAVHAKGSKIFLQIWHAGRSAHPDLVGEPNIGPSAIAIKGDLITGYPHKVPKEMTKEDIHKVLDQFKQGALNAKEAGFDGIELHGANGYLVDQFLRDASNKRTDEYGGSVENRARFCLEAIDILISVFGAGRVGIKLSPVGRYQDMYDSNPLATYTYLLKELEKKGIAYVQLVEPGDKNTSPEQVEPEKQMPEVCKALRPFFKNTIIINNNQTPETAAKAISEGHANLVSFARPFMANPDYVERVKNGWPTNQPDFATAYSGGEKGYTNIPFYKAEKKKSGGFFGCFRKGN